MQDHDAVKMNTHDSSLREQYIEYGFIWGICKEMWQRGQDMDVLRSHTDRSGYDILLEADGIERHVQLKSSFLGAKTATQKINVKLAEKPNGCIIWIWFDPKTLKLTHFLWFGTEPGPVRIELGERIARHSKGNAQGLKLERQGIRVLNKGQFERVEGFDNLACRLFGQPPLR
ncbi:MAG: hypothetical protein K8F59_01595 [Rhodobacteraceae bacterium]|nr:hypothetical protein [Paracoccaceae bacterium]